jgi:diguanylate cyclase (GGDEF)-like protein
VLGACIEQCEAERHFGANAPVAMDFPDGRRRWVWCGATADGGHIVICTEASPAWVEDSRGAAPDDAADRLSAELRFNKEVLEDHATYLATLAEESDANARRAEAARRLLEREIAERRKLEAELRRLATTDALTGVLNRRHLFEVGQQDLIQARDAGNELAVLMVDVDHFKSINDRHGHPVGDTALRQLAARLRTAVRRADHIGRLGGEEFAVVLPGIAPAASLIVAERLRAAVASRPLVRGGVRIPMTVSIGLAMACATDRTFEQVIARADEQLYRAKEGGRNRVCYAEAAVPDAAHQPA